MYTRSCAKMQSSRCKRISNRKLQLTVEDGELNVDGLQMVAASKTTVETRESRDCNSREERKGLPGKVAAIVCTVTMVNTVLSPLIVFDHFYRSILGL